MSFLENLETKYETKNKSCIFAVNLRKIIIHCYNNEKNKFFYRYFLVQTRFTIG